MLTHSGAGYNNARQFVTQVFDTARTRLVTPLRKSLKPQQIRKNTAFASIRVGVAAKASCLLP